MKRGIGFHGLGESAMVGARGELEGEMQGTRDKVLGQGHGTVGIVESFRLSSCETLIFSCCREEESVVSMSENLLSSLFVFGT